MGQTIEENKEKKRKFHSTMYNVTEAGLQTFSYMKLQS